MQVVPTPGEPDNTGTMVTWPLHAPLKSGYIVGAVELLQPLQVKQAKMPIKIRKG